MLVIVPGQAKSKGESWANGDANDNELFHEKILRVDDGYCYKIAMSIAPAIACIIARPIFGLAVPSFVEQR